METATLYYATNRAHRGKDRWRPQGYSGKPSNDGAENLRFGKLTLQVDPSVVRRHLAAKTRYGIGAGTALTDYLRKQAGTIEIQAFEELLNADKPDSIQAEKNFGSIRAFRDMQQVMKKSQDVLLYIHGFNVDWDDAVASALALQFMLNVDGGTGKYTNVFLFSWPSDGMALPYVSYKSDRSDAKLSGYAFGRGLLKLRDWLGKLRTRNAGKQLLCKQEVHLLCHSMGNYVLQNSLARIMRFNHGKVPPRLFEQIFMCAPDVDDHVFEPGQALSALPDMARCVSIYHNREDVAMYVSDYTKNNPDRLGQSGAARPALLNNKIQQIDCSRIVTGVVEHGYYLNGLVNRDIRLSIAGISQDDGERDRRRKGNAWPNIWMMTPAS